MRPQTKDIQIFFKRRSKYAILIFKIEKLEHNKIPQENVNNTNLYKKEI